MPVALELLAPAKNADFGIEALRHGADAVYIGGPAFGARASAGNSPANIERLARFAHGYGARVYAAVNTILHDDELEAARRVIWQLYEAGADAIIVQDMGLLECELPPIELHASTQCDIRTAAKARFLDQAGFSQLVLARELALPQIEAIARAVSPDCRLEFFVHGAICVAYSGQCYISHAHTGRSANRGECSQACRLPYDLADTNGHLIARGKHLLSIKDNDQSDNLAQLAAAGVTAFKIEGRLKDLSYVKNLTAHYRMRLDAVIAAAPERFGRASFGVSTYTFTPRPEKTFHRGATDYFVHGRQHDIAAADTPAFAGPAIGQVIAVEPGAFVLTAAETIHNGDGLCWFCRGELVGLRVSTAQAQGENRWRCQAAQTPLPPGLAVGTTIHRNRDQAFERLLEKSSAERRIGIVMTLADTAEGLSLTLESADGIAATATLPLEKTPARDPDRAQKTWREHLQRLGDSLYQAEAIHLACQQPWFVPASLINALRREAVAALDARRVAVWAATRPGRKAPLTPPPVYPESALSFLGNVLNQKARAFYLRHGVEIVAAAFEADEEKGEVPLMTTKHCLRYDFSLCPKEVKGLRPDPLTLIHGKEKLKLVFDCKKCEMQVMGRLKLSAIPVRTAT